MSQIVLPYRPRPWQLQAHQNMKRFSVIVIHRRAGKTVFAINTLVSAALRAQREHSRYSYIAPFQNQARNIAWDMLKQHTHMIPDIRFSEQEAAAYFPNGSRIRLFGADNAEALRGTYNDGIVADEVAQMQPEIWGSILRPTLADRKGFAVFIGTVNGINLFSELYYGSFNKPDWYNLLLDVYHTDTLDAEEIQAAKESMSDSQFRREFMCDFGATSDDILISLDDVMAAQARHYAPEEYQFAARILSCDVARYGDDRSVICRGQGLVIHPLDVYAGISNMELADKLAVRYDEFRPDACFIDAGRGEGVIDRMLQLGYDVVGVDFGGAAGSPEYFNKRTEIWCKMRDRLRAGLALPDGEHGAALRADLTVPKVDYKDASGKARLESKDAMRKRGMRSPDLADAVALQNAFPVAPRVRNSEGEAVPMRVQNAMLHDFDPLHGFV